MEKLDEFKNSVCKHKVHRVKCCSFADAYETVLHLSQFDDIVLSVEEFWVGGKFDRGYVEYTISFYRGDIE